MCPIPMHHKYVHTAIIFIFPTLLVDNESSCFTYCHWTWVWCVVLILIKTWKVCAYSFVILFLPTNDSNFVSSEENLSATQACLPNISVWKKTSSAKSTPTIYYDFAYSSSTFPSFPFSLFRLQNILSSVSMLCRVYMTCLVLTHTVQLW